MDCDLCVGRRQSGGQAHRDREKRVSGIKRHGGGGGAHRVREKRESGIYRQTDRRGGGAHRDRQKRERHIESRERESGI